MPPRNPSYVVKSRHGIWYFQYWIPKAVLQHSKSQQKLIRRSLNTKNRQEALQLARRMWIHMFDYGLEKYMSMKEVERGEQQYELDKKKYAVGAKVAAEIERLGINPDDIFAIDSYFECTPPNWEVDYNFYLDYQEQLERKQSNVAPATLNSLLQQEPVTLNNPFISELLQTWLLKSRKDMTASAYPEYKRMTQQFLTIITEFNNEQEPRLSDLTEDAIRDYRETIDKLPKGAKTKGKNIHKLAAKGGVKKLPQTINGIFSNVSLFIKWAEGQGYDVPPKVLKMLSVMHKVNPEDLMKRVPFDSEDLTSIFLSDRYHYGDFDRACDYWSPLIALFTGATLSEIPQLLVSDIKVMDGIHFIDINSEGDKQLKNETGRPRTVPIHPELKKLGFLDFVKYQKDCGEGRLFPDEMRTSDGLFDNVSKRFLTYRDGVGAGPRNDKEYRDFHSFRHLVRTELEEAGIEERIIDDIVGHTSKDRSIGKKKYSKAKRLKDKNKDIKRLKYDLDFDFIANWRRCEFARATRQATQKK